MAERYSETTLEENSWQSAGFVLFPGHMMAHEAYSLTAQVLG